MDYKRFQELPELLKFFTKRKLFLFAYGSLMWEPGFTPEKEEIFTIKGYVRDFCVYSFIYRGTPSAPGLVLGLRKAPQNCIGKIFSVFEKEKNKVLEMLWKREMPFATYFPTVFLVKEKHILTFVANPKHSKFCNLSKKEKRVIIHNAKGSNGSSLEYFQNTRQELIKIGIRDLQVEELL